MKRVIVALKMSRRIHPYIYQARLIVERLAADPIYAGALPPLDVVEAHLDALEEAAVAALTKGRGLVQARGAALAVVRSDMNALATFVQHLAAFDPDGGIAIVANAGMNVKNATGPLKGGFTVKQGRVSGGARMIAKAERTRASYEWQYSLDGKTWVSVETTVKAHQDVTELVPGRVSFFRYRSVTKAGVGDWSQVVSLLVA
jgi:hypothetical protein